MFTATTITTLGDRLASIALVFAVLEIGSATDLGLVLGARALAEATIMLFGGVLADRLPRSHVLVAASLVQGVAQTATAIAILGGTGSIALVAVLQSVYGLGAGVVIPAEVGLVPQTVGRDETLWLSLGIMFASWAAILALPSVWAIRRPDPEPEIEPASLR